MEMFIEKNGVVLTACALLCPWVWVGFGCPSPAPQTVRVVCVMLSPEEGFTPPQKNSHLVFPSS